MFKYLIGSLVVLLIAVGVVSMMMKKPDLAGKIEAASDAPKGEMESAEIHHDSNSNSYFINIKNMKLYGSTKPGSTMCNADVDIFFPTESDAKLVLKNRHNIGPFLAAPLAKISAAEAIMYEAQDEMAKSLIDGYEKKYNIKTIQSVIFASLSCQTVQ